MAVSRIGFIGLGQMGLEMAQNLVSATLSGEACTSISAEFFSCVNDRGSF